MLVEKRMNEMCYEIMKICMYVNLSYQHDPG